MSYPIESAQSKNQSMSENLVYQNEFVSIKSPIAITRSNTVDFSNVTPLSEH